MYIYIQQNLFCYLVKLIELVFSEVNVVSPKPSVGT